jgi:hypothetical protein
MIIIKKPMMAINNLTINEDSFLLSVIATLQIWLNGLTVCVSRWWAGVDSAGEQEKPEARKMLENAAESHQSAARFVRPRLFLQSLC